MFGLNSPLKLFSDARRECVPLNFMAHWNHQFEMIVCRFVSHSSGEAMRNGNAKIFLRFDLFASNSIDAMLDMLYTRMTLSGEEGNHSVGKMVFLRLHTNGRIKFSENFVSFSKWDIFEANRSEKASKWQIDLSINLMRFCGETFQSESSVWMMRGFWGFSNVQRDTKLMAFQHRDALPMIVFVHHLINARCICELFGERHFPCEWLGNSSDNINK